MKKILAILVVVSTLVGCKPGENQSKNMDEASGSGDEIAYVSFGDEINDDAAISAEKMAAKYEGMEVGDTTTVKMSAKVDDVCQSKGCWMKVNLENGEQAMVKFKDYGFFMPKDIAGKEVIINGKAFVNEVPVEEQRHYAEDGGASEEEIAAITAPKKTYSFEADGVLLKTE